MEKAYLITENTDLSKDFSEYDRLYIGDAYCEHNLLYFLANTDFLRKIIQTKKNLTIVTSSISNKNIDKVKNSIVKLNEINKINGCDKLEVVVNDYGLLYGLSKLNLDIDFIWGNFLILQQKDPYFVNMSHLGHDSLTIDSQIYKDYFSSKKINKVEIYNVFQGVKNEYDFDLNLYYPYVVYTISRYCPTGLIAKNMRHLTIVEDCTGCAGKTHRLEMTLTLGDKSVKSYYIGNKQFYKNEQMMENKNVKRIVYNYDIFK